MPFDGVTPKRTAEQQMNLIELIHDLRNLPEDWKWDYGYSCTCALGRLAALSGIDHSNLNALSVTGFVSFRHNGADAMLGITEEQGRRAFSHAASFLGKRESDVTPHDVANILEGYL